MNTADSKVMNRRLRILHLEDSRRDAELIYSTLEAEGLDFEVVQVKNRQEFETAVVQDRFDVILSDYTVPRYDGFSALDFARSKAPAVPFILLSGTLGEELAVECLKTGATDYILKQRLERLVPAIQRAVREAKDQGEKKRAEEALRETERRFREMLENVELIAMTLDKNGTATFCNDYLLRATGWEREDVLGADWFSKFIPQANPEVKKLFFDTIDAGKIPPHYENPIKTRKGELREIVWNNTMLRDVAGNIIGMASIGEDVTDRKRAEEALRENEERYRGLVELSPDAIFIQSDGKFVFLNSMGAKLFGAAEPRALLGKSIVEFVHPESRGLARELSKQLEENQKRTPVREIKLLRTDGTVLHTEIAAAPLNFQGRPATQVVVRDVTERKRHEMRLALQHEVIRILMEAATLAKAVPQLLRAICNGLGWDIGAFWAVDLAKAVLRHQDVWHVPSLDPSQVEMLTRGFSFEKGGGLPGRVWATKEPAWVPDVTQEASFRRKPAAAQLGLRGALAIPIQVEKEIIGAMEFFSREVRHPDAGTPSILRDLGDQLGQFIRRKQSEEALRDSEMRYRDLFDQANDHVLSVTAEGRFVYVNRACREALGYSEEEIADISLFDLVHPESKAQCREAFQRVMSGEKVDKADVVFVSKAGKKITVEGSVTCKYAEGKPAAAQCIFRDITERKKLEEQVRQTQKMEAIGQLAGGIAHDFNNILGCILGYTELAAMEAASNPAVQENLQEVLKASQRAKELVLQILTFSRQQEQERKPMKLQPVIKEALKLLRASLPSTIEIRADIPSEAPTVLADATQVHQIILNLSTTRRTP